MFSNNCVTHLTLVALSLLAHNSEAQQCPPNAKVKGKQCPCLSVDTSCEIIDDNPAFGEMRGMSCNKLEVSPDDNGSYPNVKVLYSWEMCNKNAFDIKLKTDYAKFFDWTKKPGSKAESINDPRFPLGGETLDAGECLNKSATVTLDTTNRYTIASQLEGFVVGADGQNKDPATDYCYAFSNESISFKKGKCQMATDATCVVQGTSIPCQDFIDQSQAANRCTDFTASFEWKACNYQPYRMKIFRDASNVKIAVKNNGNTFNDKIGRVKSFLDPQECDNFGPRTKNISTCSDEKLFYSINVQGSKPNGKFWYECQDFKFENLKRPPARSPIIDDCGSGKGGNCPPSKGGKGRNALSRRKRRATRRNL